MEKIKNFFTGMTTQTKWILALGTAAVVTTVVMVSGGGGSSLGGDSPMGATGNAASSNALKVIPKNTIGVGVIDIGALTEKVNYEELMELDLMKEYNDYSMDQLEDMLDELPKGARKIVEDVIEDPESIGIDINSQILIFSSLSEDAQYGCAAIGMSDAGDFDALLEKIMDELPKEVSKMVDIDEGDGYSFISPTDEFGVAWDDDVMLFIGGDGDTDAEDELKRLMTLESDDQLLDNDNFNDFLDNSTDFCGWISTDIIDEMDKDMLENLEEGLEELEDESGIKLDTDDLLGNSMAGFFNFGEGNISAKLGVYLNEKMQEVAKEYTGIEPAEVSVEYIFKFDNSGRNSLETINVAIVTIAEKAAEHLDIDLEDAFELIDNLGPGFGGAEEAWETEEAEAWDDGYDGYDDYDYYDDGGDDAGAEEDYYDW